MHRHKLLIVFMLAATSLNAQQKEAVVKVFNPARARLTSATLTLVWKDFEELLPKKSRTLVVFDSVSGKELATQRLKVGRKGVPEEVIFQADFAPRETRTFVVKGSPSAKEASPLSVDARFMRPREDMAWENDRIAFRMYGPALAKESNNGIDVWNKRVRSLIIQKWYAGDEAKGAARISYHEDHGEGADFFTVGKSLGCGASGIWFKDQVYQPGVFTSQRVLFTGPIRASFEIQYKNWTVEGIAITQVKTITIDAGQSLFRVDDMYKTKNPDEPITVACGLVKRVGVQMTKDDTLQWMSLWGPTNDKSENGELGLGLVMDKVDFVKSTEDKDHHLLVARTRSGWVMSYYAGAGWTRSGDFRSKEDWNKYLNDWSLGIRWPLQVKIQRTQKGNMIVKPH
jgi:pectinesterase